MELAREFECSASAMRNRVRQADRDEGLREDGLTTAVREELRRLRRENRQLHRTSALRPGLPEPQRLRACRQRGPGVSQGPGRPERRDRTRPLLDPQARCPGPPSGATLSIDDGEGFISTGCCAPQWGCRQSSTVHRNGVTPFLIREKAWKARNPTATSRIFSAIAIPSWSSKRTETCVHNTH